MTDPDSFKDIRQLVQCKFEVTGLPTGMYFVHILTGETTSVEKLIKL